MENAQLALDSGKDYPPISLSARDVCLSRGELTLIENLQFSLAPGEAVLLTGRNGAGKTTLLRALAGFVRPDTGLITLDDSPITQSASALIGWLGHADGLKSSETVRETLRFWTELARGDRAIIRPVLRMLAVDHLIDRPTSRLSRGQQRRVAFARVAVSNRPVWLLDEPAGPLDGAGRQRLAELIAWHRGRGGSVIAATHQQLDWPDARKLELGA